MLKYLGRYRHSPPTGVAAGPPAPPTRVVLRSFVHAGDAKAATNAARTFVEFVEAQICKLDDREARGRRVRVDRQRQPAVDPRAWLDDLRWLAWTVAGDLVVIEERGSGSVRVSRVTDPEDQRIIFAADRLIRDVVKLYPGDDLNRSVSRFMGHNDLRTALAAALERARRCERRVVEAPAAPAPRRVAAKAVAHRKTRFDPRGNFVVYRPATPGTGLPPFAALLPGPPVPEVFEDRRHAQRFLRRRRRPIDAEGLVIARVIGAAMVLPVFRAGLDLPREPEQLVELIRREPRVVMPNLHAEWLPRFEEGDDGIWRPQAFKIRRTVRHAYTRQVLDQLGQATLRAVPVVEEHEVRQAVGAGADLPRELLAAARVANKAERRLPQTWLDRLGMERESLAPDWRALREKAHVPPLDEGHWLRAPVEFGKLHVDGLRGRIVELRIDDLAGLIELLGFRWRFLVVKESPREAPRWVLPVGKAELVSLARSHSEPHLQTHS